jgi:uncharacterized protein YggE
MNSQNQPNQPNQQQQVNQQAQYSQQPNQQQNNQQMNYRRNYSAQGGNSFMQVLKSRWKAFFLPIVVLLVVYFGYRILFGTATITVVGEGNYDFEADQVSMIVTYVNNNVDPDRAIQGGQGGIDQLIDTTKSIADDVEIKKSFYQMEPISSQEGTTYQVVNAFKLETGSVDQVNTLVKTLYAEGASSVTNVNFSHTEQEKMAQKAREQAVKNAKQEAKRIAGAAGKRLGKIVTISDDQRKAEGSVGADSGESFKNVSITKQVSIVYKIW